MPPPTSRAIGPARNTSAAPASAGSKSQGGQGITPYDPDDPNRPCDQRRLIDVAPIQVLATGKIGSPSVKKPKRWLAARCAASFPLPGTRAEALLIWLAASADLVQTLLYRIDGEIGLFLRNDQRRAESDGVRSGPEKEQAALERQLDEVIAEVGSAFFRGLVLHQLDPDHQAQSADIADNRTPPGQVAEPGHHMLADAGRVLNEFRFEQFQGRQGRRDRDRVAAEGAGVGPLRPGHQLSPGNRGRKRHPAGNALRQGDYVGNSLEVLTSEHLSRSPHTALNFIEHQKDAVLVRQCAKTVEKLAGRDDVASCALHRREEDGCHLVRRKRRPE